MKQIVGIQEKDTRTVDELAALEREGMEVKAEGDVHRVRNMWEIVFVVLLQA